MCGSCSRRSRYYCRLGEVVAVAVSLTKSEVDLIVSGNWGKADDYRIPQSGVATTEGYFVTVLKATYWTSARRVR